MTSLDTPILFPATANVDRSRVFYEETLGLEFIADEGPALVFHVGGQMLRLQKVEHVSVAPYTVLGWAVPDLHRAVRHLRAAGVVFCRYDGMEQDADGIWHAPGGAQVAWFQDPDRHVLSLTQFQ